MGFYSIIDVRVNFYVIFANVRKSLSHQTTKALICAVRTKKSFRYFCNSRLGLDAAAGFWYGTLR